uniref:Uncharacterized protein n=1 Tax=Zea mays TaxID=4577 RepID=C4JAV0_MAIZE|nr:unknown [Zea mays]
MRSPSTSSSARVSRRSSARRRMPSRSSSSPPGCRSTPPSCSTAWIQTGRCSRTASTAAPAATPVTGRSSRIWPPPVGRWTALSSSTTIPMPTPCSRRTPSRWRRSWMMTTTRNCRG